MSAEEFSTPVPDLEQPPAFSDDAPPAADRSDSDVICLEGDDEPDVRSMRDRFMHRRRAMERKRRRRGTTTVQLTFATPSTPASVRWQVSTADTPESSDEPAPDPDTSLSTVSVSPMPLRRRKRGRSPVSASPVVIGSPSKSRKVGDGTPVIELDSGMRKPPKPGSVEELVSRLQCVICQDNIEDLCCTTCGHVYCWACIQKYVKLVKPAYCPICRKPISRAKIHRLYLA